jgi:hypothetical protein
MAAMLCECIMATLLASPVAGVFVDARSRLPRRLSGPCTPAHREYPQPRPHQNAAHHSYLQPQRSQSAGNGRSTPPRTRQRNYILDARRSLITIRPHDGGKLSGDGGVGQYVAKTSKRRVELTTMQAEVSERSTRLSTGGQARLWLLNMYAQCARHAVPCTDYPRLTSKTPAKNSPTFKPRSRYSVPATARTLPSTRQVS